MSTGIIFNSVTAFVEQVGRRLQWRYAELDNMICVYIGPQASALAFKPKINSRHPQYPLMFVTDSSITNKEALVAEVSVTYAGIIQTSGASSYITPPVTTESPVQGSRDFVAPFVQQTSDPVYQQIGGASAAGGGPGSAVLIQPAFFSCGTQNVTVRYVGTQCSIRYQAYPRPTSLHYSSLGLGRVTWNVLSQYYGPKTVIGQQLTAAYANQLVANYYPITIPPLFAANLGFEREQRGLWYNCVETYGPTF